MKSRCVRYRGQRASPGLPSFCWRASAPSCRNLPSACILQLPAWWGWSRRHPKDNLEIASYQTIMWRIWKFYTNEFPNILVLRRTIRKISEYICIKRTIRTNIRIYKIYKISEYIKWYERIEEYICIKEKFTNEYSNIFTTENIQIYLYNCVKFINKQIFKNTF